MDERVLYTSITPASNFAAAIPPTNPVDGAVKRFNEEQHKMATPLRQYQTPSGYQNLDIILARLNRIEQMIDGASISATCSGTTTVITLTWGS